MPAAGRDGEPRLRTTVPCPGHVLQAVQQPTGIVVRLEHRADGLFLVVGDSLTYRVIPQRMQDRLGHDPSMPMLMLTFMRLTATVFEGSVLLGTEVG
jgi:hypothetical protein